MTSRETTAAAESSVLDDLVATESHYTCAVVAIPGFDAVTEMGYLLSQSVGLGPGDEYELVILDSVGEAIATLHATTNDYDSLITSSNGNVSLSWYLE
jgi:hypothetical protein